ncbi:MAG: hypothetical protein AAF081_07705 [Actinomycetota bacterium]
MSGRDAAVHEAFHDDFYGDPEHDGEFAKIRAERFRTFVMVVVAVLVVGGLGFLIAGGGDGSDEDDVAIEDPEPIAQPEPVGEPTSDPDESSETVDGEASDAEASQQPPPVEPIDIGTSGDPLLDQVLIGLGVDPADPAFRGVADLIGDLLDSISTERPTFVRDDIDIVELTRTIARMSQAEVDRVFNNSTIECGATEPFLVVCGDDVLPMPAGDVYVLGMRLAAPVALADPEQSFVYSAVFDTDGDPTNDWVFNPPFDFDLFQGADRWYQLTWDHRGGEWFVTTSQVDSNQQVALASSAVRVVVAGENVVFFVPASEAGDGAHRLTSFGHDGTFSPSDRGADVSGVDPTEPLTELDAQPVETRPLETGDGG